MHHPIERTIHLGVAGRSGGHEERRTVPDLLYALLLIGGFALLVLTMRGLERL